MDLNMPLEFQTFPSPSPSPSPSPPTTQIYDFLETNSTQVSPHPNSPKGSLEPQYQYEVGEKSSKSIPTFDLFWRMQILEMDEILDLKQLEIPMSRIKKAMKSDEMVKMVSAEAPGLVSKACELFASYLTLRAWINAEEDGRNILLNDDISNVISDDECFEFLTNVVSKQEN